MSLYAPPQDVQTEVLFRLPDEFRDKRRTDWSVFNKGGEAADCFLEGPSFDRAGNLYLVDIPFGRIFRVSPAGDWTLVKQYDGWPNGLKIHKDGSIWIADYRHGILKLDPESGAMETIVGHVHSEGLKGCNDLVFASNGDLYFTDQGQTGLHDPTGRVFRRTADGRLECLIDTVPSPNGLVLNAAETHLLVGVTRANAVWRLPLHASGGTSKVGLFVQLSGGTGPDGLAMGSGDELAVCHVGLGSVWVFNRLGEPMYRVRSCQGLLTTNLAFGGPDGQTLHIVESDTGCVLGARLPLAGQQLYGQS